MKVDSDVQAPVKLHLGCGVKYFPGWTHVDALAYPHVDHVGPVERLDFAENSSIEVIYGCHVLEHFGRNEYRDVLVEWYRVLRKPGGILRLAVPDFRACAELYVQGKLPRGLIDIMGLLVGGQRDQYDYHKVLFDEPSLTATLLEVGFQEVRHWDWRETEHAGPDDYSQSYLPHMDKTHGRLMSLNLEAVT
ncbi:class I SAM-dependent methyltransferase [Sphingomonas hengshuiensis]|uniref:class I SAM-dependent methyltransferase n=1 Tax=Sphingomonas hengshuiensis TaxID=1609977 RepID=UPI000981533B|nr:methyltransferase domain-containing protein [Sphingomonas hengshuiensis]